jgi:1-pyrroline-5-carboxylate dehydrogenase
VVPDFRNEPFSDFSDAATRGAFEGALTTAERDVRDWPLVIGGERVMTGGWLSSHNPAHHKTLVGRAARATRAEAERALDVAWSAFESWSRLDAAERARVLLRTAAILRRRKHDFSATLVLEAGKPWPEADADTAEAIDFLEFYAREALHLAEPQPLTRLAGTANDLVYLPLGVGLVVPPWNFPLAILVGMTAGAIVAGNTVLLKPSSLTPVIGARFIEALEEAGLPPGVVNFIPGPGGEVGEYLIDHPRIRFVSFTGSREVGCHIYETAAKVHPGQKWLKRVVAEMGGKDAIVVDETLSDSQLDDAAAAVVASAFGFAGQKCSACSRLIAVDSVYDSLVSRVVDRARALRVGDPRSHETQVGPVADGGQLRKIAEYIEIGKQEGTLLQGGGSDSKEGFFVEPTIFGEVAPKARPSQEEIFGPVLACTRAPDYRAAIAMANDTDYGLTGAFFSREPERLVYARREFNVGNLYLNRKCTGALVGVEPFGGFNMSGTDSKAGGRDYLLLFTQPKTISERL